MWHNLAIRCGFYLFSSIEIGSVAFLIGVSGNTETTSSQPTNLIISISHYPDKVEERKQVSISCDQASQVFPTSASHVMNRLNSKDLFKSDQDPT